MSFKILYIFVEGVDDERFIKTIFEPIFKNQYQLVVKIIQYTHLKNKDLEATIKSVKNNHLVDYLFLCDMDSRGDKTLCITKRKQKVMEKFPNQLEISKIIVVKEEIESWYLAGINFERFKIKKVSDTENITKEEFERMKPKSFDSLSDFKVELLKDYSLDKAISINKSINYLVKKYKK
jgi:hypothetical protein